jgi:hypothetical protein
MDIILDLLVVPKNSMGNCKTGPLLKFNAENLSLFSTLQNPICVFKMKVLASPLLESVSRIVFSN